jgi:hypothetical protein
LLPLRGLVVGERKDEANRLSESDIGGLEKPAFFHEPEGGEAVQPGEGCLADELSAGVLGGEADGLFIGGELIQPAAGFLRLVDLRESGVAGSRAKRTVGEPAVNALELLARFGFERGARGEGERLNGGDEVVGH